MTKKERAQFLWTLLVALVMGAIAIQTAVRPKPSASAELMTRTQSGQAASAYGALEVEPERAPAGSRAGSSTIAN